MQLAALEVSGGDAARLDEAIHLAATDWRDLLGAARESLRKGDLRDAAAKIEVARKYDPGHVDLPDSVARLTEETDTLRRHADDIAATTVPAAPQHQPETPVLPMYPEGLPLAA